MWHGYAIDGNSFNLKMNIMKKLMIAAAILTVTGITALNAKDHNYSQKNEVSLQDTSKKDTTSKDTSTTKKDSTQNAQ
jgi:hypothetical protein